MAGKFVVIICIALMAGLAGPARADTQAFATCLTDSLSGKERKHLARWIFFAMAVHPELRPYSNVPAADRDSTDRESAALVTRLLAEDCGPELRAALKADPAAVEAAFAFVGQVAMQELMTNKEVTGALSNYARHLDKEKLEQAIR